MASPDPNCTCYYDDYGNYRDPKEDCPSHGQDKERRRVALGCKHPDDEPCFGTGPDPFKVRHDPPAQEQPPAPSYDPPPEHYRGDGGLDPWRYIEAHGLDYWAGNVIKYVTRAGRKEIATVEEDLIKARNFLNYMIEREQKGK